LTCRSAPCYPLTVAAAPKRKKATLGARERILAAARPLIAQHGFEATSTKEIAELAGVPSGLIFYYFETKDALIEAIFDDNLAAQVLQDVRDAARRDPADAIGAAVRALFKRMQEHRYQAFILMAEIVSSRPIAKRLRLLRKNWLVAFAEFLRTRSGGVRTAVDPEMLAQVVGSSIFAAVLVDQPSDVDAYIKGLASIVRTGLAPAPESAKMTR